MVSDFLTSLNQQVSDQFNIGNTGQAAVLDTVKDGQAQRYGKLGDFAKQIDTTAVRSYTETGYLKAGTFPAEPEFRTITFQEPEATLLVKKKMFSSLAENYDTKYMNSDEKLFYRASKILFQTKCQQISTYEQLIKYERAFASAGQIDTIYLPLILDLLQSGSNLFTGGMGAKAQSIANLLRKVSSFSKNTKTTTWHVDNSSVFLNTLGQGTGVIEITNILNLQTTTSINFNSGGQASFNITDPYNLMTITSEDIEKALSTALNVFNKSTLATQTKELTQTAIDRNISLLNSKRLNRSASPITFKVNNEAIVGKKVYAIVENLGLEILFDYDPAGGLGAIGVGKGVTVNPLSIRDARPVNDGGLGNDGLDAGTKGASLSRGSLNVTSFGDITELNLFQEIISQIFNQIQTNNTTQSTLLNNSELTNYARRKMNLHFGGKCIIQPMDIVHIYISSKTSKDEKVLGILQQTLTGYGFLQNLGSTSQNFSNNWKALFSPTDDPNTQIEKTIFASSDFPNYLWSLMRNEFVADRAGTHVFAGVVGSATTSYSNGNYSVAVSCKDNTSYFDMGFANFKPSADVFNGPLFDPITPFKNSFDDVYSNFDSKVPILLDENEELLKDTTDTPNYIKYKAGLLAGRATQPATLFSDKRVYPNGEIKTIFYGVDGLVYKWKEGIGTFVQFGENFDQNNLNKTGYQSISQNPFAGQDIMNVISLAITGVPYNFNTYYKAVADLQGFNSDPHSNEPAIGMFYEGLTNELAKRNNLWGNFIPFKSLVVDEGTYKGLLNTQLTITKTNEQLDTLTKQIQDLQLIQKVIGNDALKNISVNATVIDNDIKEKSKSLDDLRKNLANQLTSEDGLQIATIGSDVSFENSDIYNNNTKTLSNAIPRDILRKKINFLTRKLSWMVRANDDKNLLIIDDSYDKDYDLLAFNKILNNALTAFQSEYKTVKDTISTVASLLNLEVFADTQGNIRVRSPQYNKIPSSVFYRMMDTRKQTGVRLFPKFLENLFTNQLKDLTQRLQTIEDEIRLDAAILGKNTDKDVEDYIKGINVSNQYILGDLNFSFLSNENGEMSNFYTIQSESKPDEIFNNLNSGFIEKVKIQNKTSNLYNSLTRSALTQQINSSNIPFDTTPLKSQRVVDISARIKLTTGQDTNLNLFVRDSFSADGITNTFPSIDTFAVNKDIGDKISERQRLIKTIATSFKNAEEYRKIESNNSKQTANDVIVSQYGSNNEIPEFLQMMIENESFDDYGLNSGKRYIIENSQILSFNISENPPEFTSIEVVGSIDPFLDQSAGPSDLNIGLLGSSNNTLITAAAVDYDMWRIYGHRQMHSISAPFLNNAYSQIAPYAASLLSRNRQNILRANISIIGNEFMQPGEVIYFKDRDLLFYVESVNHNFSYGTPGSFTTSLVLSYGHKPGEYIPTTLDVIGKTLYNNKFDSSNINYRQSDSFNRKSVGAICLSQNLTNNSTDNLFSGSNGEANKKIINNITYFTKYKLNNSSKTQLEIRVYSSDGKSNSTLLNAANILKKIFIGTANMEAAAPKDLTKTKINEKKPDGNTDNVKVVEVNCSDTKETRSPSQKAIDAARTLSLYQSSSATSSKNAIFNMLSTYVLDCFIVEE